MGLTISAPATWLFFDALAWHWPDSVAACTRPSDQPTDNVWQERLGRQAIRFRASGEMDRKDGGPRHGGPPAAPPGRPTPPPAGLAGNYTIRRQRPAPLAGTEGQPLCHGEGGGGAGWGGRGRRTETERIQLL